MPTFNPIAHIQEAPPTATTSSVVFVAMVDGRADGDGSGVDSSGGGFVAFGEDAFFALVEEGLLGGCHGCFDLLVACCL